MAATLPSCLGPLDLAATWPSCLRPLDLAATWPSCLRPLGRVTIWPYCLGPPGHGCYLAFLSGWSDRRLDQVLFHWRCPSEYKARNIPFFKIRSMSMTHIFPRILNYIKANSLVSHTCLMCFGLISTYIPCLLSSYKNSEIKPEKCLFSGGKLRGAICLQVISPAILLLLTSSNYISLYCC